MIAPPAVSAASTAKSTRPPLGGAGFESKEATSGCASPVWDDRARVSSGCRREDSTAKCFLGSVQPVGEATG